MTDHVRSTRDGRVLHLTLARPEKKNALTRAMYAALADTLTEASGDAQVRAVVLSGEGGSFTAGNDLFDFMMEPPTDETSPVFQFLHAAVAFPKPLIAAVDGVAIGIGTTILLHCDLAYATPEARFKMPFTDLGLVPEAASSLLIPRMAGGAKAAELLLLGETFGAETAREVGLINGVEAEPLAVAMEKAHALAAKPPEAVRQSKALLRAPLRERVDAVMREEAELFIARLQSEEAQEAFTAFMEKRAPDFSRFE
ncbi:enoyl-CoA hydratase [Rubricoccus marinus]|uniref:Enoyl-CoA hydratase n=1 Tax=Rubricoccus marinus TaxID=716817 RepID=A0A259TWQ2_9BACT|nr:enoyl-CoA hydratase [Rubricoccus marinus]OZC02014.1 enoyl-CoA hydratase [Rubricoccus marinus]